MRTLRFIVENQTIKPDPNCDFAGLVPGSEGYLKAEFVLSAEWSDSTAIVASFWSALGKEYPPQVLAKNRVCDIPNEALRKRTFKIQLMGVNKQGIRLRTNRLAIVQNG